MAESPRLDWDRIVRCAIHPAIGIARVGNAAEEFYLAPEVPGRVADPGPSGFKTPEGKVKREGARFRVYGYDADGEVVGEITAADADIEWRVHLANRKAAWYQFHNAMDLKQYALSTTYRNASVEGAFRDALVIDPGQRSIGGRHTSGVRFDDGYIRFGNGGGPIRVPLGELRTDGDGRLIVLGGHGKSASADGSRATTFANNDGWYDDTSDGPVRATVRVEGRGEIEAEPAMVAVTPPNYGQGIHGVVTLYDVVFDLFSRRGEVPPQRVTFWRHVYPILERLAKTQWVNQGFFFLFGTGSPSDFTDPELLSRLADPSDETKAEREAIFRWFRKPLQPWDENPDEPAELPTARPADLPPFYGDGFSEYVGTDLADLALTVTQYGWLERWASGAFVPGEPWDPPARIEDLPLAKQPSALDRTPLEDCLGGPFHPGIELTWTLRVPRMWREPFRLVILPEGDTPQDDFGAVLTPEVAVGPDGPLTASGPGTLSRWLGIPWQTDEASCLSGYDASAYLPIPSFWAARVPNEVLSWGAYERTLDPSSPPAQRLKHYGHRQFWLRDLQGSAYEQRINNMVAEWDKIGIVTEQPGPPDHADVGLPGRYFVETGRDPAFTRNDPSWLQVLRAEHAPPEPQSTPTGEAAAQEQKALGAAAQVAPEAASDARVPDDERVHPRRRETLRRDGR